MNNPYWEPIEDPEWHCQNSAERQQHQEEIEYDEVMNKEPPWWHHIEEWLKEKVSGYDEIFRQ